MRSSKPPQHAVGRAAQLTDDLPLFRRSASKPLQARCERDEAALLGRRIREFRTTIEPAFEAWEKSHLLPLAEEEIELTDRAEELRRMVKRVEFEAFFTGKPPARIVEKCRSSPNPPTVEDKPSEEKPVPVPHRARLLYRDLARLFHPDTTPLPDATEAALHWHLLQEARRSGNAVELEKLYAAASQWLRSPQSLPALRWDPVSFQSGLNALRSEWHGIQSTEAWLFWHAVDRERFCERLKAHTVRRVQQCRLQIRRLEAQIDRWKSPALPEQTSAWSAFKRALRGEEAPPKALQTAFSFGT
jgi:hypothetical protein